jgi:hypothetical protein
MEKKYELLVGDCLRAGDRTVYRIRALRDFGDVRCGDLGGYIEREDNLCHRGECWVYDAAQVYGDYAVVRNNGRVRGCAWIMGVVEDDAVVDDLAIVVEGARVGGRDILLYDEIARALRPERKLRPVMPIVGGRTILCSDEIVTGADRQIQEPPRPVLSTTASRFGGQTF